LLVSAVLASATVRAADKTPRTGQRLAGPGGAHDRDKAKKQPKPHPGFTPEREAAAIEFVRRHHGELAPLLDHLKKAEPVDYRRTIGALFRVSERLAHIQQRNPEQYEREVKAWKLKSHIQLLVAQIRIAPDNSTLRLELKQALFDQLDLRSAQLVEERDKLTDRLRRLETQVKQMQEQREAQVERQLRLLLRDRKKHSIKDRRGRAKTSGGDEPNAGAAGASRLPKTPVRATNSPNP